MIEQSAVNPPQADHRFESCLRSQFPTDSRIVSREPPLLESDFAAYSLRSSSVVEQSAVNRWVTGSNPVSGANFTTDDNNYVVSPCQAIQMLHV